MEDYYLMQMFNLVNMIQGIKIVTKYFLFTTQAPLYYAKHVQVTESFVCTLFYQPQKRVL